MIAKELKVIIQQERFESKQLDRKISRLIKMIKDGKEPTEYLKKQIQVESKTLSLRVKELEETVKKINS